MATSFTDGVPGGIFQVTLRLGYIDADPRDVVLEAGGSFTTDEHRRALVFAFEGSSLRVEPVAAPAGVTRAAPAGRLSPQHA